MCCPSEHDMPADGQKAFLVKLSPSMDAYLLYVAMTRHREDVDAYYSQEDFADFPTLLKCLGRISPKDLAADYSILEENREFWLTVQEYKALGFELTSVRAFAGNADKTDKEEREGAWTRVRQLEEERKELAKILVEDWDVLGEYARQAGISLESAKIAAGVLKRPLSRQEQQAHLTVEQYAGVAVEARQTWQAIRRTHPGLRAKTHPDWKTFEALRTNGDFWPTGSFKTPFCTVPFSKTRQRLLRRRRKPLRPKRATFREGGFRKGSKEGNPSFAYGMAIIQAQAEAHHAQMIHREMLAKTDDPVLAEKLQTPSRLCGRPGFVRFHMEGASAQAEAV